MKLFQCQCCGQVLHFENTRCLRCGRTLGYVPGHEAVLAVEPDGSAWAIATPEGGLADVTRWRFCLNWELSACNWMVPVGEAAADVVGDMTGDGPQTFCPCCRHNRTVPDLSAPVNHDRWQRIEAAKRRLFYALRRMGLPCPAPGEGHAQPLVFDFLADDPAGGPRVMTGHRDGVVTISLTEADDAAREALRSQMGEAYRTLLGHFRHEIGHYYWDLLIHGTDRHDRFVALFGDPWADYDAALAQHYSAGPPPGWADTHVSAYATMHPWEDWAETWAHYLHMVDTLETAAAFGMRIDPPVDADGELTAEVDFNPYRSRRIGTLLHVWPPLTVALNAMNRSMGQPDLYPFSLPQAVQDKLGFVHEVVQAARAQADAAPEPGPPPDTSPDASPDPVSAPEPSPDSAQPSAPA